MIAWLMYWVAGYLFNRIDIQNRHIHMLKTAQEVSKGYHIIFKSIQSFSLHLVSSHFSLPLSLALFSLLPLARRPPCLPSLPQEPHGLHLDDFHPSQQWYSPSQDCSWRQSQATLHLVSFLDTFDTFCLIHRKVCGDEI